ncbi:MAG: SpoIID/LytB domain-containing protein [Defluviitaleaceae bacterium]|nr:SpoIID/LytB domain-containing protein [Defluviitaleaceae bacterium]
MKPIKYFVSFLIYVTIAFYAIEPTYANAPNLSPIRIGLTSNLGNVNSITINSLGINIGFETSWGFQQIAYINNTSPITAAPDWSFYFSVGTFFSFIDANAEAVSLRTRGFRAVPAVRGIGLWTVYVGGYAGELDAAADMAALWGTPAPANNRRILLSAGGANLLVIDSADYFPQFTTATGTPIQIGTRFFRGRIEIMRRPGQNLTAVNIINLEEYLWSVVPNEMPASWPEEALRAQAVASRTFSVTRRGGGTHVNDGFDLCNTTCCHVYTGLDAETAATTTAVNSTSGMLIWHGNSTILASYFASSGGFTDNSENVWINALPYLRSVAEIYEPDPLIWTRSFTLADLNAAMAARPAGSPQIGNATNMTIGRMENNRVQELIIHGTAGTLSLNREQIRTFFAPVGGSLPSRNFVLAGSAPTHGATPDIAIQVLGAGGIRTQPPHISTLHIRTSSGFSTPLTTSAGATVSVLGSHMIHSYTLDIQTQTSPPPHGTFVLNGRGHGHGVGMSQQGARGMALRGYNFIQILQHYYTGAEVRR